MTETIKLSDLLPDDNNANRGTERGRYMLEQSLRKLGAGRSILLDKNGRIIAGNKTAETAGEIGLDDVVLVRTTGDKIVAVMREDLDLDDPTGKARELAYVDNRTGQVSLDFDPDVIAGDLAAGLDLSDWWQDFELGELGIETEQPLPEGDAEPQISRADELQKEWQVETGQMWRLPSRVEGQEHRIICGDCTDAAVVERVCDIPLFMMVTDPPYGVEYDAAWRDRAAADGLLQVAQRRTGEVHQDHRVNWQEAIDLFNGDIIYLWHADLHAKECAQFLENSGFEIRAQIIWSKPHFVIGRGHYHTRHEPCWYAFRSGRSANWIGGRDKDTVWNITLDRNTDGGHSTQKPVECMARPIRNHEGDVYEPFSGSGTTIIAAENLSRQCRAIEISPAYVAVALQRYKDAFGIEPELISE